MIFTIALQIRKFSRLLGAVLIVPILVGAVGSILAGQAKEASTTVLIQTLITPGYRPYLLLLIFLISLAVVIELLALREEQRNGSKDLRKYLKEIARQNELLTPDGFFQQSVLGIVGVPLDTVFIHLRAASDRPRFDLPNEQQEALAAIRRRTDLSPAQQEEFIQALRVRWYSQIGRTDLESPGRVEVEKILQHTTAQQPGIVILGSPGSGKSTTLRWLVFQMARAACLPSYCRWLYLLSRLLSNLFRLPIRWGDHLPPDLAPYQIPIFFKVGEYAKANTPNAELLSVQAYLSFFLKSEYEHLPRLAECFLQELENGRCLVLVDGLDEVANDHMRRQVAERITAFCAHYSSDKRRHNRFIITSRIVGYEANKFSAYTHYTLKDLDDKQIEDFLSHWCPVVERYRKQSAQSPRKLSLEQQAQANKEGRIHYQRLRNALQQNPGIKNLAINPLMLTLLALLQQSTGTLPYRRVELYHMVTRTLLDNWNLPTERRVFPPDEIALAEEMLSHLAYEMHINDLLLTELKVKEIACQTMTAFYKRSPTKNEIDLFVDTIRQSSGLFVEGGQGLFCFMHRTFQEYYVAQYLITKPADELRAFVQQHCHHSIWREPFLLLIAEKSTQKSQEASDLIEAILNTKKSYDRILQRNLLLAINCVIDCNVWSIEHSLQHKLARQLFELYGDTLGAGRYDSLQQEMKRLARLWLHGQPTESSSSLPPLLAIWCESLGDATFALHQEGTVHLLRDLALDLPDCPKLVLSSLLPLLVTLAKLPELPDFPLPAEIRRQYTSLSIQPAHIQITEHALAILRLLDNNGPAGWLHQAWLTWNKEQPKLLQCLNQHALELDILLTPAAIPATQEDINWEKQIALDKNWQKRAQSNSIDLQAQFLQTSTAARFPHSYLYWRMLRQETTDSTPSHNWKASWQTFLKQEMDRSHSATYQACFNLRLLLCHQDEQQRQTLANEITAALSSSSRDQQQILAIITLTNIYVRNTQSIQDIRKLRDVLDIRYILDILDIICIQKLQDIRYSLGMPKFLDLASIIDFWNFQNPRFTFGVFDIHYARYILDTFYVQDILDISDILDNKKIATILCNILPQRNTSYTISLLFALYSLIVANEQIINELQQPVEQALQQCESLAFQQSTFMREQEHLIKAIRQRFHPSATQPASQFAGTKTLQVRIKELDALKQRLQLSKEDIEELRDACMDAREISEEMWQNLTHGQGSKGHVGHFAWIQLSHPFKLSSEAWTALLDALKDPEPLYCGMAIKVFQASKDIPKFVREQAVQIIMDILDDEKWSYRSLNTPDNQTLDLDDELFKTLQTLAEQDERGL
jgi:hypothetical protein